MRSRTLPSGVAPQSGASIVKAPKQEAEGVTIKPLEFRRLCDNAPESWAPVLKSPALAAMRPQHHWPLGNPTWKPAAVATCSSAAAASGQIRSARQDAKIVT